MPASVRVGPGKGGIMRLRTMKGVAVSLATALALVGCCLFAACASAGEPGSAAVESHAVAQPSLPEKLSGDEYEAWMQVRDENPLDEEFAASLSAFSYRTAASVLGEQAEGGIETAGSDSESEAANSAYSPISLYFALALATQGASGQTADQMNAVLGAPRVEDVPGQCGNLFRVLASDPDATVELANSVWMSSEGAFEQGFVDTATQQFYATPFSVEFGKPETDEAIAAWIKEATNGMLDPDIRTDASLLVSIINTAYFKGAWLDRFDAQNTNEKTFHAESGDVSAQFMTQRFDTPRSYVQTERYARATLPFAGGATMSFVLPAEGLRAADVLADGQLLEEAFSAEASDTAYLTVSLPKADFDSSFDLIPPLESLGMSAPFTDEADFSNLTPASAYISSIDQESHIMWNEEGAEAAAYTNIGISEMSALPEEFDEVEITLDRPFLFEIRSSQEVPLFIGLCGDPTQD